MKLREIVRRRPLLIGFLAALGPLFALLALQSWWLVKLQRTSAVASETLGNFLDAVVTEVLYSYGPPAERSFNLPSSLFTEDRLERAAAYFHKQPPEGARRIFVVRFLHDEWGSLRFYDPERETMEPAEPCSESRAITLACAPWKLYFDKGIEVESVHLVSEERDPDNRILLYPITNETSRVVGVAGMIVDTDYFAETLLPNAVRTSLPKFFPGEAQENVVITARNGSDTLVFASAESAGRRDAITKPFSLIFTDWRIGAHSRQLTLEEWAQANFGLNMTLSVMTAILLTGGLAVVLRTASRETKLSRMKSDFVSNVSHELRTPLASIRVFGEFLRLGRATTPEKVREYGEYIESESRRLTQLINNILDFGRIESGRKIYNFETGDVGAVLDQTLRTFEVRMRHDGFTLEYEGPDRPVPIAPIDPDALGQAFHNLIDNAINYSGGSRWVGVRLQARGEEIVVSVADRGIGIPEDERRKIFDRFHRVGTGLVHDVRGSGLGLSIVRHIVEAHRGHVTVESDPGRGSVFSIHLPASPRGEDQVRP